ncbi:MAG: DsrE family protein [Sulfuricaulis sp.]
MSFNSSFTRLIAATVLVAGLTGLAATVQAAENQGKQGVVIQVSENNPAVWNLALNNAKNVQDALGAKNVDVEIVAYGPGLKMLMFNSEAATRIKKANAEGVAIRACGTTMKKTHVTAKDLAPGVEVVPGGVIEIMKRQKEGWAYIKP